MKSIMEELRQANYKLLLSSVGNSPAIILIGEAEILIAPYIK